MHSQSLAGQVAFVTGASKGIGFELALALASRGAAIAGIARGAQRIEQALADISEQTGARTLALVGDVTDRESIASAVAQTNADLGPIDLLINNAGLVDAAEVPIWEADPVQWWAVVESHILGALLTVNAVVPAMVARGSGRVINLASGMGTKPQTDYSAYSVGKAGQMRLTECLAESLNGTGVFAFNIAPGLVETEMTKSMPKWDGHTAWTPPERVVELVCSAATGDIDVWHGRFLRAGVDLPSIVRTLKPVGGQRQLRLETYGANDPMA